MRLPRPIRLGAAGLVAMAVCVHGTALAATGASHAATNGTASASRNASTNAVATTLTPARNLAIDAKAAASASQPIIVLVSLGGCPHCEVVRRSHLLPLLRDTGADAPVIRQVELNGDARLVDFAGKSTSHGEFARRYQARLAPVVFFFAPNGDMLADPLVGAMIPDFYGAYFDAALAQSRARLQKPLRAG